MSETVRCPHCGHEIDPSSPTAQQLARQAIFAELTDTRPTRTIRLPDTSWADDEDWG